MKHPSLLFFILYPIIATAISSGVSGGNNDEAAEIVFIDEATEEKICFVQPCGECQWPTGRCRTQGPISVCCYPNADQSLNGNESLSFRHNQDFPSLRGYKN